MDPSSTQWTMGSVGPGVGRSGTTVCPPRLLSHPEGLAQSQHPVELSVTSTLKKYVFFFNWRTVDTQRYIHFRHTTQRFHNSSHLCYAPKCGSHLSPYDAITLPLTPFPRLCLSSPWLIHSITGSPYLPLPLFYPSPMIPTFKDRYILTAWCQCWPTTSSRMQPKKLKLGPIPVTEESLTVVLNKRPCTQGW